MEVNYVMPNDLMDSLGDIEWTQMVSMREGDQQGGGVKRKVLESRANSSTAEWKDSGQGKLRRLDGIGEASGDRVGQNMEIGAQANTWQHVEDLASNLQADFDGNFTGLDIDLKSAPYNLNDTLLGLPSLTTFKEESPLSNQVHYPNDNSNSRSGEDISDYHQCSPYHGSDSDVTHLEELTNLCPRSNSNDVTSSNTPSHHASGVDEIRFQYILGAATSTATKLTEESLTYLNQGQSYEIKLKRQEGHYGLLPGTILRSVIRVSFHDRRLQYTEREQMALWQASRPGDRILEVDLPLSYGVMDVVQDSASVNSMQFHWDPRKEAGVYIKVNCISTEFTPKKHGGEKGVPFRIQVDTFILDSHRHLHSASCQIKVFKLKGADRKHKQDREKILKRPAEDQTKYQPSCDYTVLTEVTYNADIAPATPALSVSPQLVDSSDPGHESNSFPLVPHIPRNENLNPQEGEGSADSLDGQSPLRREFSSSQVQAWLQSRDFASSMVILVNYSGADMLRLSREDLTALCGLSEGIRLFNAMHPELLAHKRTIYLLVDSNSMVYHPVYLYQLTSAEMCCKLVRLLGCSQTQPAEFYLQGPNDIHVIVTDELVNHIKDESMFSVDILTDSSGRTDRHRFLLKPIASNHAPPA